MFDAAVIGGGLAGCSAAITLAMRGHRVALVEAGRYPRAKVCGEFLSPEVIALFDRLDFLPTLQSLGPKPIETVRITASDGSEWRSRFPAPGVGLSRYALDAALASHAAACGVTVFTDTRVNDVVGDLANGFNLTVRASEGERTIGARAVIAAHGRRSALDKALQRPFTTHDHPFMGLKQHFAGPPLPRHIDLHVFRGGYCGVSEVEDGAYNVCLLVRQSVFQAAGGRVESFIAWMRGQNRALGDWLAEAEPVYPEWLSIAQVPFVTKSAVEGDLLVAGDAAGMIAPLAGDGMAMALHSGQVAADHLHEFLRGAASASAAKQAYARAWRSTFAARLTLGRWLQAILLRPSLIGPGLRVMRAVPPVADTLMHHTRDMNLVKRTVTL